MELIQRVEKLRSEMGVPLTIICKQVGISPSTFYALRSGNTKVSAATEKHISDCLAKYGL